MIMVVDILECFGHVLFVNNLLEPNRKYKNSYFIFFVFFSFIFMESTQYISENIQNTITFMFIPMTLLWTELFFENKILDKLAIVVLAEATIFSINTISLILFSAIFHEMPYIFVQNQTAFIVCTLFSKIIYIAFAVYLKKFRMCDVTYIKSQRIILVTSFFYYSLGIVTFDVFFEEQEVITIYLFMLTQAISLILVLLYYLESRVEMKERKLQELEKMKLDNIAESYEIVKETIKKEQILRHDLKHILSVNTLDANITKQLEDTIDTISENILVATPNETLNAVLNSKIRIGMQKGIHFEVFIGCYFEHMEALDLVALFGNLLDNAIENCGDEHRIKIETKLINQLNQLVISNSVNYDILRFNPNLKTSKELFDEHGIGIQSCRNIIKKYGGNINFISNDHKFVVKVIIDYGNK